jgi:hypothetical protein
MGWAARLAPSAKHADLVARTRRLSWHAPDPVFRRLAARNPAYRPILAAVRPQVVTAKAE